MTRKRYTEEQIIGVLKESEAGAKTGELCRKHGGLAPFFVPVVVLVSWVIEPLLWPLGQRSPG